MKSFVIILLLIMPINCLETKFIQKTETFSNGCNNNLDSIYFEKQKNECNSE